MSYAYTTIPNTTLQMDMPSEQLLLCEKKVLVDYITELRAEKDDLETDKALSSVYQQDAETLVKVKEEQETLIKSLRNKIYRQNRLDKVFGLQEDINKNLVNSTTHAFGLLEQLQKSQEVIKTREEEFAEICENASCETIMDVLEQKEEANKELCLELWQLQEDNKEIAELKKEMDELQEEAQFIQKQGVNLAMDNKKLKEEITELKEKTKNSMDVNEYVKLLEVKDDDYQSIWDKWQKTKDSLATTQKQLETASHTINNLESMVGELPFVRKVADDTIAENKQLKDRLDELKNWSEKLFGELNATKHSGD